jgi:glutaredoxin
MVLQRWLTPAVMMVPSKTIERRVHGLLRCAAVCREDIMSTAVLYRMATSDHLCPFGLKSKDLLERKGFEVEDHLLETRADTDRFMAQQGVETTPQTFIAGERVGGYDDLRERFGLAVKDADETRYTPVWVVFGGAALAALALQAGQADGFLPTLWLVQFVALAMLVLAMLKLQDLESFSNRFLGYDLLAQRVVRYAYVYPFAEAAVALAMLAWPGIGLAMLPFALVAVFIGTVGAVSVVKAVYIDKRELKCACVGGGSPVPLGAISLSENLAMLLMGLWMLMA